ncbi:[citrate (pro-3S)-lyase] ligase [Desulfosporosinus fructosivorans]|uniref:[Citrate [pro-3S]-lyase] ligase n=1 Tax=Desulfosporosinus fructosivorans TaxID=2018669 RepID=A0A4Z0RBN3_9FIRM|nr:[citrate (pro-3S)-lyase] ligase [Desulfosporosinus fructosivorans]TGE39649.1 [citrate (pro-3S)-lyase] ligase [Desulfosporosinus fructosivorans]
MNGVNPLRVNLKDRVAREEVEVFLQGFDLVLDQDVDYTLIIRDGVSGGGNILATCSKAKSVLKCFAVKEEFRGEGLTASLISSLIDKLFSEGIYHSFIFTKPANSHFFEALNYKPIQSNADVALLENGIYDIQQAITEMKSRYSLGVAEKAALVMNCNPFTLGHYYLIEEVSKNNQEVLVFVVEEDRSIFPFKTRYELVSKGVEHLENVQVLPSGEYIISSTTFPSYFIKEEGARVRAYSELDASIFGKYFCGRLNITKRYIGEEPYCPVTAAYNAALEKVLPSYGVKVTVIPRKSLGESAISASRVRNLLKVGDFQSEELNNLLPEVTLEFLNTSFGKEIVEKLKRGDSPH